MYKLVSPRELTEIITGLLLKPELLGELDKTSDEKNYQKRKMRSRYWKKNFKLKKVRMPYRI